MNYSVAQGQWKQKQTKMTVRRNFVVSEVREQYLNGSKLGKIGILNTANS